MRLSQRRQIDRATVNVVLWNQKWNEPNYFIAKWKRNGQIVWCSARYNTCTDFISDRRLFVSNRSTIAIFNRNTSRVNKCMKSYLMYTNSTHSHTRRKHSSICIVLKLFLVFSPNDWRIENQPTKYSRHSLAYFALFVCLMFPYFFSWFDVWGASRIHLIHRRSK